MFAWRRSSATRTPANTFNPMTLCFFPREIFALVQLSTSYLITRILLAAQKTAKVFVGRSMVCAGNASISRHPSSGSLDGMHWMRINFLRGGGNLQDTKRYRDNASCCRKSNVWAYARSFTYWLNMFNDIFSAFAKQKCESVRNEKITSVKLCFGVSEQPGYIKTEKMTKGFAFSPFWRIYWYNASKKKNFL